VRRPRLPLDDERSRGRGARCVERKERGGQKKDAFLLKGGKEGGERLTKGNGLPPTRRWERRKPGAYFFLCGKGKGGKRESASGQKTEILGGGRKKKKEGVFPSVPGGEGKCGALGD